MRKGPPLPTELWDQVPSAAQAAVCGLMDEYKERIKTLETEVARRAPHPLSPAGCEHRSGENCYGVLHPEIGSPVLFPDHALAHQWLDGLRGLEIGAAAHNPFGLNTRNVAPRDDYEFYAEEARKLGVEPARVDIAAFADDIPVPSLSEDFVLSSHVVEHLANLISTFVEWNRIVRDGGYVFMIVPLKGSLPADAVRELTSYDHILEDYRTGTTVDTHPTDDVPGGRMGHYHTFTPDSLLEVIGWMNTNSLCDWELVAREDIDSKVGNGFTLVFRVKHRHNGSTRKTVA